MMSAQHPSTQAVHLQIDPVMAERMATWVVWAVINSHRRMEDFLRFQKRKKWPQRLPVPDNGEVVVLVLGSGGMGGASAAALHALGAQLPGHAGQTQRHHAQRGFATSAHWLCAVLRSYPHIARGQARQELRFLNETTT